MHAFSGCPNLKTVTINGTNLAIAERAFQGDEALETLIINNTGIVSIGDYAFMIEVAEDDDDNVEIGGGEIGGWVPGDNEAQNPQTFNNSGSNGIGYYASDSEPIERKQDKLYSITLPQNVVYTTDHATSFKNRVRSISIEETTDILVGDSTTLTPIFTPDTAFDNTIIWKSSNESVATVDSNGKITGVSTGEAIITATTKYQQNGVYKSATCVVNVMTHTHNWTYTASGDTITATCEGTIGTCPVETVTITLVAPENLTYDGQEKVVTVTQSPAGVFDDIPNVTYGGYDNCVNVGSYTASLTYNGVTATLTFTIGRATPTVAWDNTSASVNYTGSTASITAPTVTLVNGEPFSGTISYSYTGTSSGNGLPINAGTYEITASIEAQGNYNAATGTNKFTLTINKATAPEIQWPTASGLTYGQKLPESNLTSADANGTFAWQDGNTVPTVTNSGYVVVYTPNDTHNYDYTGVEFTKTIPVTVSPKEVTVRADDITICVDGTYTLTYTVDGLLEGDTLTTNPTLNTNATVATAGEYTITVSGATVSDNYAITYENGTLTVRNHAYNGVMTTTPTCMADGEMTYTCSHDSSHTYTEDVAIDENAHTWNEGAVTTNPTCTEKGVKTYTCTHNSAHTYTEDVAIDKDAHAWNEGVVTTNPTCSAVGVKTFTCTRNSAHTYTEDVAIDENAHAWSDGVVTTNPTCTEKGVKTFTCTHNSAHTYTEDVAIDANAHVYDNACDADCNACGETRTTAEHYSENADGKCDECGERFELSGGAIAGIVIGSALVLGGGGFALYWFVIRKKRRI